MRRWFPPSFVGIGAVGAEKTRKEVRQKRGGCSESPPQITDATVTNQSYGSSPNGAERRKINAKTRRKAEKAQERQINKVQRCREAQGRNKRGGKHIYNAPGKSW